MHRHLGTPPWALSHDDLCHLSSRFGFSVDLRTPQDQRINEWLKRMIARVECSAIAGKTLLRAPSAAPSIDPHKPSNGGLKPKGVA
jgi:hypothetical protein